MGGKLILVRHAAPNIDPELPSAEWPLSEEGREAARRLWPSIAAYRPASVLSGPEPKLVETAALLARQGGLPHRIVPRLAEHSRSGTKFVGKAAFEAAIQRLFLEPDAIVYGDESATATCRRFAEAIDEALAEAGRDTVMAVSGGTAISLFLARRSGADGYALWRSLRLPMAFVLDRGHWTIEATLALPD